MQMRKEQNVITLSEHPAFEKNELAGKAKQQLPHRDDGMDFIETLFRFLGDKRQSLILFIRMKLDRERRASFSKELGRCRNLREESRCVKKYIGHLKVNDANALLMGLTEILPGKIEAFIHYDESSDKSRQPQLVKTFGNPEENWIYCIF